MNDFVSHSNRFKVVKEVNASYQSNVHNPTGKLRTLQIGETLRYDSTAPNGNVWFFDSSDERCKIEAGSLENLSDRLSPIAWGLQ